MVMAGTEGGDFEKESNPAAPISPETAELDRSDKQSGSDSDLESASGEPQPQVGSPLRPVVTAQDWTGPDDPENPHNWPLWKRVYNTAVVSLVAFAVTFASSIYTPAYHEVSERFHVSRTASLLPLSLYVVGLAFGPIISAPISENMGRNIVYKITVPISMLFTLGAGFSQNFGSLLVCRFLAAFAGSAVLAVGGGTNVDLWPPQRRAAATSAFLVAPFLGPALGPFIGGFVAQYKNWRWTQWCILFVTAAIYVLVIFTEETYKKIILKKRAKRLGIAPPKKTTPSGLAAVKFHLVNTLFRPLHMLFVEPIVLFLSLYTAFAFSVLFGFFAAFPYIFRRPPYNFTVSQSGLVFLAVGLGVVLAGVTGIIIDRLVYQQHHHAAVKAGKVSAVPEHRLYAAMMGSLGLPIGVFWFAWCADKGVHWAVLVVAMVPFAWGNLLLFISTALYLIDVYGPLNGASGLAANGILRYAMGAAFPLFTIQMYEALGIGWATSLLGFVSVAMIPIPWVLFKFGANIRAKSNYPTTKF